MLFSCRAEVAKEDKKKRKKRKDRETEFQDDTAIDEDVVEELILSDEDDGSMSDSPSDGYDVEAEPVSKNKNSVHQKPTGKSSKRKAQFNAKKSKKRKKAN